MGMMIQQQFLFIGSHDFSIAMVHRGGQKYKLIDRYKYDSALICAPVLFFTADKIDNIKQL